MNAPRHQWVRTALAVLSFVALSSSLEAQAGKTTYDKWCSGCHGDTGAGNGPGGRSMLPHPRDFTKGVYKIRTTASGEIPTDDDLRNIIATGMAGTAMPAWKPTLSDAEITAVIAYIKSLSSFFGNTKAKAIAVGKAPSTGAATLSDGQATFRKLECFKCHGENGRGDGPSSPTLKDDYGNPIRAADLTENWKFRGGRDVTQIYTRLRTGLDGTPMPSFSDAIENKLITDEQLWHVAQYVRSLSPDRPPEARDVVRAAIVRALPTTLDDPAWKTIAPSWVPLVGQVIAKPRAFAPTVDGVWVQAAHDGSRLALKLTWDDPSRSPSPAWEEWRGRIAQTFTDVDGPPPAQQGPDRLVVQFPQVITDDTELPYFLGGSKRTPVYVWNWASDSDRVAEGRESGLGQFTPVGSSQVHSSSRYANGQWQLLATRAFAPADTAQALRFLTGRAIPFALFAADGSSGEDSVRGSVSAWYALYLDVPTPTRVYVFPIATVTLSAGLGLLVIARAQRREHNSAANKSEEG